MKGHMPIQGRCDRVGRVEGLKWHVPLHTTDQAGGGRQRTRLLLTQESMACMGTAMFELTYLHGNSHV